MLTVYGIQGSPFVRKVRAFLLEKGVDYNFELHRPGTGGEEYRKLHPLGKVPALRDGDRTLCDSSAICAYLERIHPSPRLYPEEAYAYARALWFEEYSDSAIVAVVGAKIFVERVVKPVFLQKEGDDAVVHEAVEKGLPPLFDYLEGAIAGEGTVLKEGFCIADVAIGAQLQNLSYAGVGVDGGRWPKVAAYAEKVLGRESFRKLHEEESKIFGAVKKAG